MFVPAEINFIVLAISMNLLNCESNDQKTAFYSHSIILEDEIKQKLAGKNPHIRVRHGLLSSTEANF